MQAQVYEGYFDKGKFYAEGRAVRLPERKKLYIKVLDDPINNTDSDDDDDDDDDYDYSIYFTEDEKKDLESYYAQRGEVLIFGD